MENAHVYFDFLSIDPVTIIGVLCNTLILFLIFKKLLFGRVGPEELGQPDKCRHTADTGAATMWIRPSRM